MNTSLKQPFYFQLIILVGFIFIALMLFALARLIYRDSFQVGRYIDESMSLIEEDKKTGKASKLN